MIEQMIERMIERTIGRTNDNQYVGLTNINSNINNLSRFYICFNIFLHFRRIIVTFYRFIPNCVSWLNFSNTPLIHSELLSQNCYLLAYTAYH